MPKLTLSGGTEGLTGPLLEPCDSHASYTVTLKRPGVKAKDRQEGGAHYRAMSIEPWDVIDTWPAEQRVGADRAGAIKYIMRMGAKDERTIEARKAAHYCQKLIETLEAMP